LKGDRDRLGRTGRRLDDWSGIMISFLIDDDFRRDTDNCRRDAARSRIKTEDRTS
jgi:hypothetical protein